MYEHYSTHQDVIPEATDVLFLALEPCRASSVLGRKKIDPVVAANHHLLNSTFMDVNLTVFFVIEWRGGGGEGNKDKKDREINGNKTRTGRWWWGAGEKRVINISFVL